MMTARGTLRIALMLAALVALQFLVFSFASAQSQKLENPLNPAFSSVPSFIEGVLRTIVVVALPIITLFIVIAGFMFVKARGNPGEITDAKRNFFYVMLGAILILGAWVLATLIAGTVTQLVG